MNAELVRILAFVTVIGDAVFRDHVDHRKNVRNATRMEPDRPVVAGDICHPVCGRRPSLCCELHVSINLADVLHEFGVRDDVACGLVVQEIPSIG